MTNAPRPVFVFNRHFWLVAIAILLEAIIGLAYGVPFALPKPEAWQAAAFLFFFASFL